LEQPEIQLVSNIREGNKQAFEEVFRQYYQHLCSYAYQIIHDHADSEEIVQDLFVKLWQKRDQLNVETSLKSYLFRSVHNSCLNHIKHNNIRDAYMQQFRHENPENEQYASGNDDTADLHKAIGKAIDALPPERKKVFLMIRYEERKYKEVAEILGISVKTVENQMTKAIQFLKKALNEYLSVFIVILMSVFAFFFNSR
jgi:RNA polymerase sigma-70 factor (ECF subfamily)